MLEATFAAFQDELVKIARVSLPFNDELTDRVAIKAKARGWSPERHDKSLNRLAYSTSDVGRRVNRERAAVEKHQMATPHPMQNPVPAGLDDTKLSRRPAPVAPAPAVATPAPAPVPQRPIPLTQEAPRAPMAAGAQPVSSGTAGRIRAAARTPVAPPAAAASAAEPLMSRASTALKGLKNLHPVAKGALGLGVAGAAALGAKKLYDNV